MKTLMMKTLTTYFSSVAALMILIASTPSQAKNVDLVTLPKRDTVQLTIYNSEDLTLAKEVRAITLKKGGNRLQFSWANTLIDPTSVELRPLEHADQIEVVDTVFPGQKPQHLFWNIESEFEGQVLMEVSYFTSGLTWKMDYVAITNPAEDEISFRGHVRVFNNSGEEYDDAEIRLIVGKVNLVEKIADLARRGNQPPPQPNTADYGLMKNRAMRESISLAVNAGFGGGGGPASAPKKVVKEGVSEYFMFSVDGTETISNGWSKRMPAVNADEVQFDIVYRMRAYQYGPRPVRFFLWKNDEDHQLGDSPLPDGVVRVFRENGQDGLSYLGQQSLNYVPIQADIEVNLGPDDLVVFEQRKIKTSRNNFHFDRHKRVTGWDEHRSWLSTIRNYRDQPIRLELRLQWPGDVEVEAPASTTSFDYRTLEFPLSAKARDASELRYRTTTHHGSNAKQNRVKLALPQ